MRDDTITCDFCGADLLFSSNSIDWSIELKNRRKPCIRGPVTDMYIEAQLDRNKDFCGVACLKKWLDKPKEKE